VERERIIEELSRLRGVSFAVLFGSQSKQRARADSDWDVAIYFDVSISSGDRARARLALIAALEPAIPVDVVILNEAPTLLARRALDGEPLVMRDRREWVRFAVRTLAAAGDEAYWNELHARERMKRLEEGRFGRS
jgi:predicted nucleotidyltransferase